MAYLLDSNVFIEAKQRYYEFSLCPGFWEWLSEANAAGRVYSIEKVGAELAHRNDGLSEWAAAQGEALFLPPDEAVLESLVAAVEWARRGQFRPAAITAFADDADVYLVACAHAHGHTVVTHERPSDGVKQVKIPNVCVGMNVRYLNTFEMLRREGARFVLDRSA
jgi:predicted nucleic acid-binding protein